MLKVAKKFEQPKKPLILPSREVNADTTADKSLSEIAVQHGAQPKELTDKKSQKMKIPSSSEAKTSNIVRESSSKKQVADTQPAKEIVATADATLSLNASKLAEEQGNQLKYADATMGMILPESIIEDDVRDSGITLMGNISFEELSDQNENKEADKEDYESPFNTESEIKFIGKEASVDNTIDELVDMVNYQDSNLNAFADKPNKSDPLGHLHKEIRFLTAKVEQLGSLLSQQVANKFEDSVPKMVADAFEERIPKLLYDILRNILPQQLLKKLRQMLKGSNHLNKILKSLNKLLKYQVLWWSLGEEPPVKKLKIFIPDFSIPSPTPLKSIMPQGFRPPVIINDIPFDQYIVSLFSLSSFEVSSTPRHKIANKGKSIAIEEDLMKQLMPFIEKRGSTLKILNLKQFSTSGEGRMTIEDAKAQMEEIKRLAALKREKKESEKRLKVLTSEEPNAHATKLAAYEAKRAKMLEEAIKRDTPEGKEMYNRMDNIIEARNDVVKARKIVTDNLDNVEIRLIGEDSLGAKHQRALKDSLGAKHQRVMKGLTEYKASASNLRRIQVKDIIKEIKDYLKTYSPAKMDIIWYVEGIC
nr:hypothetical protein [Tanacetum cinerariifolium]